MKRKRRLIRDLILNKEAPIVNCSVLSGRSGIEDVAKLVLLMPRRSLGVGINDVPTCWRVQIYEVNYRSKTCVLNFVFYLAIVILLLVYIN